jgi:hypothetical protein
LMANMELVYVNQAFSARIARSEDGTTTIQFPLDLGHMEKMKWHIKLLA